MTTIQDVHGQFALSTVERSSISFPRDGSSAVGDVVGNDWTDTIQVRPDGYTPARQGPLGWISGQASSPHFLRILSAFASALGTGQGTTVTVIVSGPTARFRVGTAMLIAHRVGPATAPAPTADGMPRRYADYSPASDQP